MENVSWFDTVKFCNVLSEQEGLRPLLPQIAGPDVTVPYLERGRLSPSNRAEWEYACRAGNQKVGAMAMSFGIGLGQL